VSDDLTVGALAHFVHAMHCAMQAEAGDTAPAQPWETLDEEQHLMVMNLVVLIQSGATPEAAQMAWVARMEYRGFRYGEVKDYSLKTHPAMVPWGRLPLRQRRMVIAAYALVESLTSYK